MQHEERVLAEQIENLQKEKYKKWTPVCLFTTQRPKEAQWCLSRLCCREELTFEMLSLEPRASDDETLDSEASIGTGDSSENLNVDSEETISDVSGRSFIPAKHFVLRF